ncbi:MAG: transferrin-binding protein-like solute binding protein [Silicimonas sp.]|nr:transferrin-binding protein-like solute binding protein [Silicimonas sp.]
MIFKLTKPIMTGLLCTGLAACASSPALDARGDNGEESPSGGGSGPTSLTALQMGPLRVGGAAADMRTTGLESGENYDGTTLRAEYAVGFNTDGTQAVAYAGLDPSSDVGITPLSGTAGYSGEFELAIMDNVVIDQASQTGDSATANGSIDFLVDFDTGTFSGSGGSMASGSTIETEINLEGSVDGNLSQGTVDITYEITPGSPENLGGAFEAVIGTDALVGMFIGGDSNTVAAGVFDAEPPSGGSGDCVTCGGGG